MCTFSGVPCEIVQQISTTAWQKLCIESSCFIDKVYWFVTSIIPTGQRWSAWVDLDCHHPCRDCGLASLLGHQHIHLLLLPGPSKWSQYHPQEPLHQSLHCRINIPDRYRYDRTKGKPSNCTVPFFCFCFTVQKQNRSLWAAFITLFAPVSNLFAKTDLTMQAIYKQGTLG